MDKKLKKAKKEKQGSEHFQFPALALFEAPAIQPSSCSGAALVDQVHTDREECN
ncbi:hypothetical protein L1049_016980 [Liquidambar formosana]|uniref:Uncharacterized protein n=1 Tax=Liquidambar formosana TaxID=63359 RepID=A0AAP0X3G6_LIQFO